jgi:HemK-related putative methylase
MSDPDGVHFILYQDCLIRVPSEDLLPKFGALLLARHLPLREEDTLLDLGTGSGLVGISAARRGHRVVATDVVEVAAAAARANAVLNGVADRVTVRVGDLFAPVAREVFDVIAVNPPQMPVPPDRAWGDARAAINDGGADGWTILDRVLREVSAYLRPQGRLVFTLFDFLGLDRALVGLRAAGLVPALLAREAQPFPWLARERLEYLRSLDQGHVLPPGLPAVCDRLVLCGEKG